MADKPATPETPAAPPATETPAADPAPVAPLRLFDPDPETPATEETPAEPPAAPAPPAPEPKKEEPTAPRFAALMKQEAELRKAREEMKAKEKALEEREAKMKAGDPIAALEAAGFTYEQATEWIVNGKKPTPEMVAAAEAKKRDEAIERLQAAEARREAEHRAERAVKAAETFKTAIKDFTGSNVDKFECINATPGGRGVEMVYQVVEAYYASTGELLGGGDRTKAIELAAEEVETYLESLATPLLTTKKFQSKLTPSRDVRPPATSAIQKQPPKTLSNSQAAVVPPRAPERFTNPDDVISRLVKGGLKLYDPD
jgi:hypothetical protein